MVMMKEGCSKTTILCLLVRCPYNFRMIVLGKAHRSPWKLIVCIMAQKPLTSLIRQSFGVLLQSRSQMMIYQAVPTLRFTATSGRFLFVTQSPRRQQHQELKKRSRRERERLILIYTKQQLQWQSGVELWTRPLSSPGNDFSERRTESKGGRKS